MNKLILAILSLTFSVFANAEYTIKVPLEIAAGGTLDNGSIKFTNVAPPVENWISITPSYSEWVNDVSPLNCITWTPDPSDIDIGQSFTQNSIDCEQNQIRTIQNREQEQTTLEIRNVGLPITENRTLITSSERESIGTMEQWPSFASNNSLAYTDWSNINWSSKNLTSIPTSLYPNPSAVSLNFFNNKIKSLKGLRNLTSLNYINVGNNLLTNLNGLEGLKNASWLQANGNQLTTVYELLSLENSSTVNLQSNNLINVDGLVNLKTASYVFLQNNKLENVNGLIGLTQANVVDVSGNNLQNINGLANISIVNVVKINSSYSGPKLAADTRFCSLNSTSKFSAGFATKAQVCNI